MSYIYLGQPYTHDSKEVEELRYQAAMEFMARMAINEPELVIYSPIVHWHNVARTHNLPTQAAFWWGQNKRMLTYSKGLWVLNLEGWTKSRGLAQELYYASEIKKPIKHFEV